MQTHCSNPLCQAELSTQTAKGFRAGRVQLGVYCQTCVGKFNQGMRFAGELAKHATVKYVEHKSPKLFAALSTAGQVLKGLESNKTGTDD